MWTTFGFVCLDVNILLLRCAVLVGCVDESRQRWLLFFGYAQANQVIAEIRRARRTSSAAPTGTGRALRIAVDDVATLQF